MRDTVWTLPAIVFACLAVAGVVACKKEAVSSATTHLPEVKVVTVVAQTVADEPEFLGETEASRVVEIRSQVTGLLKERFFTEGRDVKQGDKLS